MSPQIQSRHEYDPHRLRPVRSPFVTRPRPGLPLQIAEELGLNTEQEGGSLPILATANDAREVVRFLKRRPNGVTVVEAMNAEPRRIFDARKIAAYEFWGIVVRENERLTLTPLGRQLAESLEPEVALHRSILHRIPAYKLAIRNIYEEELDVTTHPDVLRFWSQLRSIAPAGNAQDMEAAVVCFFSICHAAELGTSTVGKRGQPARLRVDMEQVAEFLSDEPDFTPVVHESKKREHPVPVIRSGSGHVRRVLVSANDSVPNVEHIDSLLGLAGFESSTVKLAGQQNGILSDIELSEMRQCQAGLFVVRPDDCTANRNGFSLRPEQMTRISVASALFEGRVVLFWIGPLPPPVELVNCGLKFVTGEDLNWEVSLEMVNEIKQLA